MISEKQQNGLSLAVFLPFLYTAYTYMSSSNGAICTNTTICLNMQRHGNILATKYLVPNTDYTMAPYSIWLL
jgi:hypothetical protein